MQLCRDSTCRSSSAAFTLIELLVVVAIISLLVSILIPSLTKAKQLAQSVVCSSNLAGITKSLHLFAEENEGIIPKGEYDPSAPYRLWWPAAVQEVMGNIVDGYSPASSWSEALLCPTSRQERGDDNVFFSYALNSTMHNDFSRTPMIPFYHRLEPMSAIQFPSLSPAVMDSWYSPGYSPSYPSYMQFLWAVNREGNPPPLHIGGRSSNVNTFVYGGLYDGSGSFNTSFFDGHIEPMKEVPAIWNQTTRETVY